MNETPELGTLMNNRKKGYQQPLSIEKVLHLAKPHQSSTTLGYCWYACGGDNWGLDPANGVLPLNIIRAMSKLCGPSNLRTGQGGYWFPTQDEATIMLDMTCCDLLSERQEKTSKK